MEGWIKLHRKLTTWEWYTDSKMVHLFLHLLLTANHKDGKFQGIDIKKGQVITGRHKLSASTGLSEQNIRTCLSKLEVTNEITIQTTNKNSLITIINYDFYQCEVEKTNQVTSKSTNQLTNNQPTTNQQLTTNNNDKNEENENKLGLENFEFILSHFKREKIGVKPFLERMKDAHGISDIESHLKKWHLIHAGKIKNIGHAENSFNIYLEKVEKEKPKGYVYNPPSLKSFENNGW